MSKNYYVSGGFNVSCDVCSKKIKASEAKHRWDGFVVCPEDYEQRHPQDFVKARQDKISVPFSRPIPAYIYTDVNVCTQWSRQGVADQGTADCAHADLDQNLSWLDWVGEYCSISMQSALADRAITGCVIAGKYTNGGL